VKKHGMLAPTAAIHCSRIAVGVNAVYDETPHTHTGTNIQ